MLQSAVQNKNGHKREYIEVKLKKRKKKGRKPPPNRGKKNIRKMTTTARSKTIKITKERFKTLPLILSNKKLKVK